MHQNKGSAVFIRTNNQHMREPFAYVDGLYDTALSTLRAIQATARTLARLARYVLLNGPLDAQQRFTGLRREKLQGWNVRTGNSKNIVNYSLRGGRNGLIDAGRG